MMTIVERKEYVLRRARVLANSGRFADWRAIERELRFEEHFPEARQELDHPDLRSELDAACGAARSINWAA